ncbi:hypothetical protein R1sor_023926 [Riccia sorocarpa]|uniref:Uncharacterized protein n=1 Tax=Riccia sorocarpa TaxID=122646 RepID=A0ABD3GP12_9MARC
MELSICNSSLLFCGVVFCQVHSSFLRSAHHNRAADLRVSLCAFIASMQGCVCSYCVELRFDFNWIRYFCKCPLITRGFFTLHDAVRHRRLRCRCGVPDSGRSAACVGALVETSSQRVAVDLEILLGIPRVIVEVSITVLDISLLRYPISDMAEARGLGFRVVDKEVYLQRTADEFAALPLPKEKELVSERKRGPGEAARSLNT